MFKFILSLTCYMLLALSSAARVPQAANSAESQAQGETTAAALLKSEALRLNTLGAGYMNKQEFERARTLFSKAYSLDSKLMSARLNEGIALLNQQNYADANKVLLDVVRLDPKSARAWFNLGLLYKSQGQSPAALDAFRKSAELDPADADTQYLIGQGYLDLKQYAEAAAALKRALQLDPFQVSAEFALARASQRQGDTAAAREHAARFQRLTQEKIGTPLGIGYGQQGKYSYVEQLNQPVADAPPPIKITFTRGNEGAGLSAAGKLFRTKESLRSEHAPPTKLTDFIGSGACFFDYDGDGLPDLFIAKNESGQSALFHNLGKGRFADVTAASGIKLQGRAEACAAGDYDNDGRTDLAISHSGGVALFHNEGGGRFRDVSETAGVRVTGGGVPMGLTFVDYDHDGDLDLFITRFAEVAWTGDTSNFNLPLSASANNVLLRNNGGGKFTDVSETTGIAGGSPSLGVLATDVNADRAIDLVVTGWRKTPIIFSNLRENHFQPLEPWDSAFPAPTAGVAGLDFDKDGRMDLLFSHWGAPGITLWRNLPDHRFTRVALPATNWIRGWGLAVLDYDNDGWLDIVAVGESRAGPEIRLFRNLGSQGFQDVTSVVGLDKIKLDNPRAVLTADYDGDGATDLLITQNNGSVVLLKNNGAGQNAWIKFALTGNADNRSAIGAQVQVFAGAQQQKWEVSGASGYLGQSSAEITAGLGKTPAVDLVRIQWPTGVVQDEVELRARLTHRLNEIDRRSSSCPLLFAWNGNRYEFISDAMGAGIIGYWNLADPTEYLKVEGHQLQPQEGRVSLKFTEPMEEVNYLDQVRLLAVDHPANAEVYPNERFVNHPPFPEYKVIATRGAHLPLGAWDDTGQNVLAQLKERDHRYVDFKPVGFTGFAEKHTLELDLGSWDPSRPLRLIMHGYTEYFTATSVYSAKQVGLESVPPYVEALDTDGHWQWVQDDLGFPAGLPRTIIADLTGRLPRGAIRIRIVTNLQIYWDQILIDSTPDGVETRSYEPPISAANLSFRGFPKAIEGATRGDVSYDYSQVSKTGPFARPRGNYTRFGDVRQLLTARDDRFVIFGPGEEISLEFDVSGLPSVPQGWKRDYFFYVDGFTKDMDLHGTNVLTVDPLPFHDMPSYPYPDHLHYPDDDSHLDYLLNYNTRFVAGDDASSYRFYYPAAKESSDKRTGLSTHTGTK
jgi:tetratricopeptide (TPR) repeat protein